jgi:Flp pilus assembly pilin Flp
MQNVFRGGISARVRQTSATQQPGQSMVEIGVIIALMALAVILILTTAGVNVNAALCQVARAFGASQACGLLFSENFDNLDAWEKVRGKWDLENGRLCGGPGEGRIFTPIDGDNYRVNIDQNELLQGNGYGVFFRASDVENVDGYTFQYDPGYGKGEFLIRKWVNGYELPPIARAPAPPNYDWHNTNRQIELVVDGDNFAVSIDGEEVVTAQDSTYSEGGVGLRTWWPTRACFDDMTVEALP